jgi:hypothetical protein
VASSLSPGRLCLADAISCYYWWKIDRVIGQGVMLSRLLSCIRATIALAAIATVVAGCAVANNTASSQGEQPYQTGYGLSSAGTTTDLYTELFGARKPAAAEPIQPAPAPQPAQPTTTAAGRPAKPSTVSAAPRQVQPAPVPVEVAQQPATPQAPPEPDVPVSYGITANGPTTDLYTELFGPKRPNGQ